MTKEFGELKRHSMGLKCVSGKATCRSKPEREMPKETFEAPAMLTALCTYTSYAVLIIFGHLADFLRKMGLKSDKIFLNVKGGVSSNGTLLERINYG